ncbi:hypothetical protein [Sphingobium sp. CAP-1]|uniref:hypothetical protein n=1 Tax=Sphingobium sp. CAP-1 TaxID=2676077 RepID=UPI0012BB2D64|nr:hypothetical protein [Sphingobium sp. CAP-1]QGP79247.1 hypothetical protein GL174_09805 [Sphingobium sp. CAP-1]
MTGELRALGLAHGLLLGLLLASPWIAPDLLPWAVEMLFVLGGFQLRLADRRWDMRGGMAGWVSHIRMAPRRLIPWGAAAVVALIAGTPDRAQAIAAAALLCELLLYPVCTHLLGRLSRPVVALLLLVLIAGNGTAGSEVMRYVLAFVTGVGACLFWLRGPDGEARALILSLAGATIAAAAPMLAPMLLPFAFALGAVCLTLALAHLSILRRRPLPWRLAGTPAPHRRALWQTPPRPS